MWNYNNKVMDHFIDPKNVGEIENPDGYGEVGNASCGDALRLTFKLDDEGRIADVKFKTFGCVSAIAASSALTEIIKGMTIDEAAKVTNADIVKVLGDLPEEKMHCSVMGMEALQAAIANYRGEPNPFEEDDEHEGRLVCKCFGITDVKIAKVAKENNLHTVEEVTHYSKAGGACGACLDEIQQIIDDLWNKEEGKKAKEPIEIDFASLNLVQKVIMVQGVLENEIKPALKKDGGDIELINVDGFKVHVKLKGRCAGCPSSGVTINNFVQDKLREIISPKIEVIED